MTLQYPAPTPYPTMKIPYPNLPLLCETSAKWMLGHRRQLSGLLAIYDHLSTKGSITIDGIQLTKRDLDDSARLAPIGTINPDWQCNIRDELVMHAMKTLSPWNEIYNSTSGFLILNAVFNSILDQEYPDPTTYFNTPAIRAEYHAPEKTYMNFIPYPFNGTWCASTWSNFGDPSIAPSAFLSDLAAKVPIVFYAGSADAIVGHRGTELAIQNLTFGGIRGFTVRPSTQFSDSDGNLAGIIHSERNVTYALFKDAGHGAAWYTPNAMYTFLKEFVIGTNQTGNLDPVGSTVVGGVHTEYIKGIFTGSGVHTGSVTVQGTYTWPESVWNVWNSYMVTRTAADVPVATDTKTTSHGTSIKLRLWHSDMLVIFMAILGAAIFTDRKSVV